MKKNIFVLLAIGLLFSMMPASAQISSRFFSGEQKFIKDATVEALYIVRQDYILKDTTSNNPNEYGFHGEDYFGRIYRLAVLSDNKLWCDNSVKMPWFFDENYNEYRNNKAIRPALSKVAIRMVNGRDYSPVNLAEIQTTNMDSLLHQLSIVSYALADTLPGIANKREIKSEKAWIVLASTKEDIKTNDTCDIKLSIYLMPAAFAVDKLDAMVKAPSIGKNLLGGIYFEDVASLGKIELFFTGVLIKKPVNWYISSLPKESGDVELSVSDEVETNQESVPAQDSLQVIVREDTTATLKFIHKDGFALQNQCHISIDNSDQEFCTDENGIVKIPVNRLQKKRAGFIKW
jgi:hypothetical protein